MFVNELEILFVVICIYSKRVNNQFHGSCEYPFLVIIEDDRLSVERISLF